FFALMMWADARNSRDSASTSASSTAAAAKSGASSMPGMDMSGSTAASGGLTSYAGAAPANADDLPPAPLPHSSPPPPPPPPAPAAPAGPAANVNLTLKDIPLQIAPGIKYAAWAGAGGAPGPIIHVRQGQTVKITLTNDGAIPHSVDFHAARIAPNVAFADVMP